MQCSRLLEVPLGIIHVSNKLQLRVSSIINDVLLPSDNKFKGGKKQDSLILGKIFVSLVSPLTNFLFYFSNLGSARAPGLARKGRVVVSIREPYEG